MAFQRNPTGPGHDCSQLRRSGLFSRTCRREEKLNFGQPGHSRFRQFLPSWLCWRDICCRPREAHSSGRLGILQLEQMAPTNIYAQGLDMDNLSPRNIRSKGSGTIYTSPYSSQSFRRARDQAGAGIEVYDSARGSTAGSGQSARSTSGSMRSTQQVVREKGKYVGKDLEPFIGCRVLLCDEVHFETGLIPTSWQFLPSSLVLAYAAHTIQISISNQHSFQEFKVSFPPESSFLQNPFFAARRRHTTCITLAKKSPRTDQVNRSHVRAANSVICTPSVRARADGTILSALPPWPPPHPAPSAQASSPSSTTATAGSSGTMAPVRAREWSNAELRLNASVPC